MKQKIVHKIVLHFYIQIVTNVLTQLAKAKIVKAEKPTSRYFLNFRIIKKPTKINLAKATVTQLNNIIQSQVKGNVTRSFLNYHTRGLCTVGTGVLCY